MSRLDKFEDILNDYEGREYKKDTVTCNNMLFVLGELALGDPPASKHLYTQIRDGTFDIAHNNDDENGYCGLNYTFDFNEHGERRWGWCSKKDTLAETTNHKFERYDACLISPIKEIFPSLLMAFLKGIGVGAFFMRERIPSRLFFNTSIFCFFASRISDNVLFIISSLHFSAFQQAF